MIAVLFLFTHPWVLEPLNVGGMPQAVFLAESTDTSMYLCVWVLSVEWITYLWQGFADRGVTFYPLLLGILPVAAQH